MPRYVNIDGDAVQLDGDGGGGGGMPNLLPPFLYVVADATGGSAFSPGPWVQLTNSLPQDSKTLIIGSLNDTWVNAVATDTLLQIGLGSSGNETPLVTIPVGYGRAPQEYAIAGLIAAGQRVSFRVASSIQDNKIFNASFVFHPTGSEKVPVSSGFNLADASVTRVTYAGSINTRGPWTEIVSSSPECTALSVIDTAINDNLLTEFGHNYYDIAIGPSGSEVPIIENILTQTNANERVYRWGNRMFDVNIPAGTRISARFETGSAQNNNMGIMILMA